MSIPGNHSLDPTYTRPLNADLYNRLRRVFPKVVIARPNENFQSVPDIKNGKTVQHVITSGEYYRVNCPFCHRKVRGSQDSRQRLWINHRWGVPDAVSSNWWLAICYHTGCLAEPQFLKELRDLVYTDASLAQRRRIVIAKGETAQPLSTAVDWPGLCLPLTELPANHPAIVYLRDVRRFDPAYLSSRYDVRFCIEPSSGYSMAVNRIICPVYVNGRMVTWQGRYTGDADWKQVPKYYNHRGAAKSATLYDFDFARQSPIITLVEGPMDAWRHGTGMAALLGRTLSETQVNLICTYWKAAIVALDADALLQSEMAVEKLRRHLPTVMVTLPEGFDPDTMPVNAFWDLVLQAAKQQSVNLDMFLGG